jgi:hypothetical protein
MELFRDGLSDIEGIGLPDLCSEEIRQEQEHS